MHECLIGLLRKLDDSDLVTFSELKEYIKEEEEFNKFAIENGIIPLVRKIYSIEDYASKKKTNLIKFKFCPICGKKVCMKELLFR